MYLKAACAPGSLQPEAGTVILQATGPLRALTSFPAAGVRARLALAAPRGAQPAQARSSRATQVAGALLSEHLPACATTERCFEGVMFHFPPALGAIREQAEPSCAAEGVR